MNAFIEILAQLIESVPSETWLEQTFFPFRELKAPKARLFDACLFRQSASGALGVLWIQFESRQDVLALPFRLTRYSLEGEFISLPPWSLREASSDSEFFDAWRMALHAKNPLVTAANGLLMRRYSRGEPALVALNISSDKKNTCVRLDASEAYKFFHVLSAEQPDTMEVEVLQYLTEQNTFTNFPKLISVHEYSMGDLRGLPIAISMKYIQNSGSVWHEMTRSIQKARFVEQTREHVSREAWYGVLRNSQNLGRLLGEFHRAMSMARTNPNLVPETDSPEERKTWLSTIEKTLNISVETVLTYRSRFPAFSDVFSQLSEASKLMTQRVSEMHNIGLRIRTHGHLHLGQMLVGTENLFLIDFESDTLDNFEYRKLKHSSLNDVSALLISVRFAWYVTERSAGSPFLEAFLDKESEFGRHVMQSENQLVEPQTYHPSLEEIENTILKSYMQVVAEDAATRELLPDNSLDFRTLLNFYIWLRALKETIRDYRAGNPRCKFSLKILQQILQQMSSVS